MCQMSILPIVIIAVGGFTILDTFAEQIDYDLAPAQELGGKQATVSTTLTRQSSLDEEDSLNMEIRFFDQQTNENFDEVIYRVEIWQNNELLAKNQFFDLDGRLDIKINPQNDCDQDELLKCMVYGGLIHVVAIESLYVEGEECTDYNLDTCGRTSITGPLFTKEGRYSIKISIESIKHKSIVLREVLKYNNFLSMIQEQYFSVNTTNNDQAFISIKSHYDTVGNFMFNSTTVNISFDMSYNWDPRHVDRTSPVRHEIGIPPSFAHAYGSKFVAYVNDIEIGFGSPYEQAMTTTINDDGSSVVRILLDTEALQEINSRSELHDSNSTRMTFRVITEKFIDPHESEPKIVLKSAKINAGWWADGVISDDAFLNSIETLVGTEGAGTPMIERDTDSSGISKWIKKRAGWWADGVISDDAFLNGIQFLVQKGILKIQ